MEQMNINADLWMERHMVLRNSEEMAHKNDPCSLNKRQLVAIEFAVIDGFNRLKNIVYLFGALIAILLGVFVLKVAIY